MKIEKLYTVKTHDDTIYTVKINFDSSLILTGSKDRTVSILDISTGNLIKKLSPFTDWVCDIAFAGDKSKSDYIYCGTCATYNGFSVWNLQGKYLVSQAPVPNVYSIAVSEDGTKLAMAGRGLDIITLNVKNQVIFSDITKLPGDYGATERLCFSPDNQILASCSFGFDRTGRKPEKNGLRLWSTKTTPFSLLQEFSGTYIDADFSPDGKFLAGVTQQGHIKLIDVAKQETTELFNYLNDPQFRYNIIKFHPNNKIFAVSKTVDDGVNKKNSQVSIYDRSNKELIKTIESQANIISMTFSPNGKYLAIGEGRELSLWGID